MSVKDLADTWSSIYSPSPAIKSALAFTHIGALVGGGGAAIAADRTTLRAMKRGQAALDRELEHLHHVHLFVIVGLAFVIVSGLLLMLADLDAYLSAPVFWIKMALVLLAVLLTTFLGTQLKSAPHDAATPLRGAARPTACVLVVLWLAIIFLGRAIAYDVEVWGGLSLHA